MIRMKDRFDPEHKIRKSFGTDLCLKTTSKLRTSSVQVRKFQKGTGSNLSAISKVLEKQNCNLEFHACYLSL